MAPSTSLALVGTAVGVAEVKEVATPDIAATQILIQVRPNCFDLDSSSLHTSLTSVPYAPSAIVNGAIDACSGIEPN
jgi:hypothetical protein